MSILVQKLAQARPRILPDEAAWLAEHRVELADDVGLEYFRRTCDLEYQIRDSLLARGFDVTDNDHDDTTLHRFYEFGSTDDVKRCLEMLEPLDKYLANYEGHGCGPVENEPLMVWISVTSLWAAAEYLRRHPRFSS